MDENIHVWWDDGRDTPECCRLAAGSIEGAVEHVTIVHSGERITIVDGWGSVVFSRWGEE